MSFVSFRTHSFKDKTFLLPVHLFKLIMNGLYLTSTGFISIRVVLTMHGSWFRKRNFVAKYPLKPNKQ